MQNLWSLENFQVSPQVPDLLHEQENQNKETNMMETECRVKKKVRAGKEEGRELGEDWAQKPGSLLEEARADEEAFLETKPKSTVGAGSRKISLVNMNKSAPAERQTLFLAQETEAWMTKENRFLSSWQWPSNTPAGKHVPKQGTQSLYCTPEPNIILHVNYILQKPKKKKQETLGQPEGCHHQGTAWDTGGPGQGLSDREQLCHLLC